MRDEVMGFLRLLTAWLACWMGMAAAAEVTIPQAADLRTEATLASERGVPLLIMFSAEGCRYCMRMEKDFLKPMIVSGQYEDRVLIRKIEISGGGKVRDFDGRDVAIDALAKRYEVTVTPTLVFLDPAGHQLTEKMVGLTTPDFFGGYLDAAIETSLQNLRSSPALAGHPGACAPPLTC